MYRSARRKEKNKQTRRFNRSKKPRQKKDMNYREIIKQVKDRKERREVITHFFSLHSLSIFKELLI